MSRPIYNLRSILTCLSLIVLLTTSCKKNITPKCIINLPDSEQSFTAGDDINIQISATDEDGIIVSVIIFIDGTEITSLNSTPYNYTWITSESDIGSHTIKALATDDAGESNEDQITITIDDEGYTMAGFSASTQTLKIRNPVSFTDESTNSPTEWLWEFGDGSSSTEQNPTHIFSTAGTYNVSLSVTNNYNTNTITKSAFITVEPFETGTITDIQGRTYGTVKINDDWWMSENLAVTKYNDGTDITKVTDYFEWSTYQTEAYCWYGNDSITHSQQRGALYNWHTVNTGMLCPDGWHVPSLEEWNELHLFVKLTHPQIEGKALKSQSGWAEGINGTDSFGFTAVPAGVRRYTDGAFNLLETAASWWTSTRTGTTSIQANIKYIVENDFFYQSSDFHWAGKSIRCIKD